MFEKVQCLSKAFTLAEVLIVLGIIGLIADMTIPTLHQNIQTKTNVVRLQKVYSTFESAYRLAVAENGTPENWGLISVDSGEGAERIKSNLRPFLNILSDCESSSQCWFLEKYLNGTPASTQAEDVARHAYMLLADGTGVVITVHSASCKANYGTGALLENVCASIDVDVNGAKKPNTMGKDIFTFFIARDGIIPLGTPTCKRDYTFEGTCQNRTTSKGFGCAAWVIYKGNMDYLTCQGSQCGDLKW